MFPTCVGMNRKGPSQNKYPHGVPHMRGDEPWKLYSYPNDRQIADVHFDVLAKEGKKVRMKFKGEIVREG